MAVGSATRAGCVKVSADSGDQAIQAHLQLAHGPPCCGVLRGFKRAFRPHRSVPSLPAERSWLAKCKEAGVLASYTLHPPPHSRQVRPSTHGALSWAIGACGQCKQWE